MICIQVTDLSAFMYEIFYVRKPYYKMLTPFQSYGVIMEQEIEVAQIQDYFADIGVAALKITDKGLDLGDVIHFVGHTTDLIQEVSSIQKDHQQMRHAEVGEIVGIKVLERVREHDRVFKVILEE